MQYIWYTHFIHWLLNLRNWEHTHTHTHTQPHIHTYIHTHIHTYTHTFGLLFLIVTKIDFCGKKKLKQQHTSLLCKVKIDNSTINWLSFQNHFSALMRPHHDTSHTLNTSLIQMTIVAITCREVQLCIIQRWISVFFKVLTPSFIYSLSIVYNAVATLEFFLNETELSLNSVNSANSGILINH